jgi:hypothetical protein
MSSTKEIISEIKAFEPEEGNWLRLDELITELWEKGNPQIGIKELFGVFERYPKDDGFGVFWSILHGIETLEYEQNLYESLLNNPSYMGIIMLKRIENTGLEFIAGKRINELKKNVRNNPKIEPELLSEI